MAFKTDNSAVVFHVMGNRFSDSNPGSCAPGDQLAVIVEEDPDGAIMYCCMLSVELWFSNNCLHLCTTYLLIYIGLPCYALYNDSSERIGFIKRGEIPQFVAMLNEEPHGLVIFAREHSSRDFKSSNITGFEIIARK